MLDRKEFLTGIAGFTVTIVINACGGDDSEGNTGGNGNCADGVDATITNNHGHELRVAAGDFDSGESKTYSIKGSSAHDHSVTLSAQDFTDLKAGQTITKESTNDSGHTHPMQIKC